VSDGADYLGIGPCFPSPTKSFADHAPPEFLRTICGETSLPVFAIGGITAERLEALVPLGVRRVDSLAELMRQSDIVSVHAPLNEETRKLIGRDALAAAKRGMILVNTARGPIVDIDALHDAMKDGTVLAAGLDVLPDEPANLDAPLLAAWHRGDDWLKHRLVITPHSAFFTPESVRDIRAFSARTAARYLRDGRLENCVNAHLLEHRR
jgi:phosphoglycerate dehydrogenase-like enzyme